MRKQLTTLLLFLAGLTLTKNTSAQCTVDISPATVTINCGETVDLFALGLSTTPALSTDFNGNAIGAGWQTSATLQYNNPCGPSLDGTASAWFGNVPLPRTLTTNGFNLSCGGQVCFDLDFAADDGGNSCEDPDEPDEGVYFQYSVNGGATWIDIFYFDPVPNYGSGTNPVYNWQNYCFTLPPGAWSANTMFQWDQPQATSSVNDHWGIDNVTIIPSDCSYWYDWDNVAGTNNPQGQTVAPSTTTTYNVTYTNGINSCTDAITVVVNAPTVTVTADDTNLSCGECANLNAVVTGGGGTAVCQQTATASGYDDAGTTASINNINCPPAGSTVTGIFVDGSFTGTWCPSWYDFNLVVNGSTILTGVCSLTDYDLTPYLPITSVAIVSTDNDAWSDYITLNMVLDIYYTTPATYTYSWSPTAGLSNSTIVNPQACPSATTTYTLTVSVGGGCTVSDDITLNVVPDNPPTASNPAPINVQCAANVPAPNPAVVTDEADDGGTPTVTWVDDTPDGNTCPQTITRRYRVEDNCGNFIFVYQTITIIPTTNPSVPANGGSTVNCVSAAQVQPTAPAVTDVCGNPITPTVVAPSAVVCEGTMTWQFTYTDCAGNSAVWNYTYTIDLPAFTVPANGSSTVNCLANATVPTPPSVNDLCGNAITPVMTQNADPVCEGSKVYTFTYTDCANNTAAWTYTYTIDMPPFTLPASGSSTVNCISNLSVPTPPSINDQCGNPVIPVMTENADPACEGDKVYTFTYTDCANNTAVWTYTYTIDIPAFTLPANGSESVVCIGDVYIPTPPSINDQCGNPVVPVMTENADPVCVGDKIYTFTYTDCANNTAVWTYTFSINDNVPPTGTAPADISITNLDPIPAADPNLIIDEADNCAAVPTVTHVGDVSDNGTCPEIITRTYRITDACGNFIDVVQLITIGDAGLPTASNPLPITVECISQVPAPDPIVVIDETDDSGTPTVTWEDDTPNGTCPLVIDRRYRVTDLCGNFIFVTQTITVVPSTNPVVPADGGSTVSCLAAAQVQPAAPAVTDVCGNPIIPVVTTPADIVCEGTMTWVFTYEDCAGNTSVWNYTYTIDLPAFITPANQTESVVCFADIYIPTPPTINDVCGNNIVPVMTEGPDPVCSGNKVYTFTYTDCAGTTVAWTYTFTINDNVPPSASNPVPISVPGAPLVPAPDPTVVIDEADNCTAQPAVAWVSDVSDGNVCNNEVITRTYSVTDDCGNVTYVTQLITIEAVPAPINAGPDVLICFGDVVTLTADNPWGVAISWDNNVSNGLPFNPTMTNTYTVTANNYGCISTDAVLVTVEALPTVSFVGDVLSGCEPVTTTFTNNSVGESPLVNCVWQFSNGVTVSGCDEITYTFQNGGLYDVTLTTTTANGCVNSVTYNDYVYVENIPLASFTANPTNPTTIDPTVDFHNTSVDATAYTWTFGDGSPSTGEVDPSHTYDVENPGYYTVELIATSPLGCADTVTKIIRLIEELIFYVPNTFTPDGDNYNEFFKPVFTSGYDPYDFTLLIFNRWGEILWESHNVEVGWDGTYGGKIVQDGTYTWTIEFKTNQSDERVHVEGHLNVIK